MALVVDQQEGRTGVGDMLRTAILAALRDIEACLASSGPSPREVHLARRAAKRLRALARLAPLRLSTLARQTTLGAQRARRGFGGARDADVRKATLDALREHLPDDTHACLRQLACESVETGFDADREAVGSAVRRLIRDWTLCDVDIDFDQLAALSTKTYRRARRRMKRAATGGTGDLHRWRAAVVDHEYIGDFLAQFAPDMGDESAAADRLRKLLGDLNDLDMLCAFVRERKALDERALDAMRRLNEVVAVQRAKARERALRLGEKTYAARPKKWRKRLMRSFATGNDRQILQL